jgi:hypothetical protein
MRFLVVERVKQNFGPKDMDEFGKVAIEDIKYKAKLEKKQKIVGGGPFLDVLGVCYILETKTIEEMGDILFDSPSNFFVEREVHPLGTFKDTLEGMKRS